MNNKLTDERLSKILSEIQATITEHNSRCVRGSVEVDARLFEVMLLELQLRRKADSAEPILYVMQGDGVDFGEYASTRKAVIDDWVGEWNENKEPDVTLYKTVPLYAAPQPAPDSQAQATLKRLAVILHGSEVDLNLLTVTAQSLMDRCKLVGVNPDGF
ncbi:hypothetical protein FDX19_15480 [Citrobacter sp. wls619]|uniref:hypothetical protein n=1 Tax=Citrobacter sp. wls619 TaxID=2576432 RepID=UPI0010C9F530|nr:hypothetical protein [Citrobacter sp. wls619]TKV08237.1 hypothetical protein FDX19_15480 [Citrobacter sp. wls619]